MLSKMRLYVTSQQDYLECTENVWASEKVGFHDFNSQIDHIHRFPATWTTRPNKLIHKDLKLPSSGARAETSEQKYTLRVPWDAAGYIRL
jgi:hypothetical protein